VSETGLGNKAEHCTIWALLGAVALPYRGEYFLSREQRKVEGRRKEPAPTDSRPGTEAVTVSLSPHHPVKQSL
jgi:hypothetical protein